MRCFSRRGAAVNNGTEEWCTINNYYVNIGNECNDHHRIKSIFLATVVDLWRLPRLSS
jgi:hypothetical protein